MSYLRSFRYPSKQQAKSLLRLLKLGAEKLDCASLKFFRQRQSRPAFGRELAEIGGSRGSKQTVGSVDQADLG